MDAVTELFERIADENLLVRRLNLTAGNVLTESAAQKEEAGGAARSVFAVINQPGKTSGRREETGP